MLHNLNVHKFAKLRDFTHRENYEIDRSVIVFRTIRLDPFPWNLTDIFKGIFRDKFVDCNSIFCFVTSFASLRRSIGLRTNWQEGLPERRNGIIHLNLIQTLFWRWKSLGFDFGFAEIFLLFRQLARLLSFSNCNPGGIFSFTNSAISLELNNLTKWIRNDGFYLYKLWQLRRVWIWAGCKLRFLCRQLQLVIFIIKAYYSIQLVAETSIWVVGHCNSEFVLEHDTFYRLDRQSLDNRQCARHECLSISFRTNEL